MIILMFHPEWENDKTGTKIGKREDAKLGKNAGSDLLSLSISRRFKSLSLSWKRGQDGCRN